MSQIAHALARGALEEIEVVLDPGVRVVGLDVDIPGDRILQLVGAAVASGLTGSSNAGVASVGRAAASASSMFTSAAESAARRFSD